jgi:hypothetical protein
MTRARLSQLRSYQNVQVFAQKKRQENSKRGRVAISRGFQVAPFNSVFALDCCHLCLVSLHQNEADHIRYTPLSHPSLYGFPLGRVPSWDGEQLLNVSSFVSDCRS